MILYATINSHWSRLSHVLGLILVVMQGISLVLIGSYWSLVGCHWFLMVLIVAFIWCVGTPFPIVCSVHTFLQSHYSDSLWAISVTQTHFSHHLGVSYVWKSPLFYSSPTHPLSLLSISFVNISYFTKTSQTKRYFHPKHSVLRLT